MIIKEISVKGVVTKSNLPDAEYVINPYVGCQHGCIYCYAEFMKKFTDHHEEWGSFVDVKINSPELLKGLKGRYKGKDIFLSSVTDPYQPLEAKYMLTRKILERLVEEQPIIEILTKSALVKRDIDLFKKFKDISIGISLSTLDNELSRKLEPFTSPPKLRLDALKKCKEAGLKVYVFVSPIIPYITDVDEIVKLSSFADYVMFENLNLRPTNINKIFDFIRKNRPDVFEDFKRVDESYWKDVERNIRKICKDPRIYFHHGSPKKQKGL